MNEYYAENRKDVGSFDKILNSLYGEPGTPQRDEFRREAYTYCVATIIHGTRKREGLQSRQKGGYLYCYDFCLAPNWKELE